jgi:hypothetical protein
MLADRRFVTEAGKLTTEGDENEFEKCAQHNDERPFKKKAGGRNHLRVT